MTDTQIERSIPNALAQVVRDVVTSPDSYVERAELPPVRLLKWGEALVEGLEATVSVEVGFIRLDVVGPEKKLRAVFHHQESLPMPPLRAEAADGRVLEARSAYRFGSSGTAPTKLGFQLLDWALSPVQEPSTWVGRLHGLSDAPAWCNLRVAGHFGRSHLYLPQQDGHDYAVLWVRPEDDLYFLLVDTKGSGVPERSDLERDLATLEFLYGVRLRVDHLRHTGERDHSPALFGSRFGRQDRGPHFPNRPVLDTCKCWAQPIFRCLAPRVRSGPPEVRLAIGYFLDSFTDHPDEAYLKLTVVIEGLAMQVLRDRGEQAGVITPGRRDRPFWMVRDLKQWREFRDELWGSQEYEAWERLLKTKEKEIGDHAITHDLLNARKWLTGSFDLKSKHLGELSAGRRVEAALAVFNLSLDEEMRKETKRWNHARHSGVAKRADEDGLRAQIAVLRVMLIGLLLRWVGYEGPILGHTRAEDGRLLAADPDWWGDTGTPTDTADADLRFVATG